MKDYWENKLVLVAGGSSGIGLATACALAARAANVWLVARRPDVLEAALAKVKASAVRAGQHFGTISADLSDPAEAFPGIQKVIQQTGVPDVLINSAGAAHPGYVQELTPEIFRWMMDANYFSAVYATKAVLPGMINRHSGHIINISSAAGFLGVFGYTAYGASKCALGGFSEVLRAEMRRYNIRVSLVYPSDTQTPQLDYENRFKPPETKAISGNASTLKPEQVARAIVRQAARGQFSIFASFDVRVFYLLNKLLPKALVFAVMDAMANNKRVQVGE
jgi:3-dehydrosphinganine reductase